MGISQSVSDTVAIVRLEFGRGNAIGKDFLEGLNQALDEAMGAPVRALVITGQGRAFSGGLDLVQSYDFDRAAMERYVDVFDDLFCRVATFPKPVVAAVNGHALAGGCILAMAADYRVMARGPYLIGIHEVVVGIPFPSGALEIARKVLPSAAWAEAFLEGRRYSPEEALSIGLVHKLSDDVVADAVEQARRFCVGSAEAIRETKADLLAPMVARIEANKKTSRARFLEYWFGQEARSRIGKVRNDLLSKKGVGSS